MSQIHDRMPAILTPDNERLWIDDNVNVNDALELLTPIESDQMGAYEMDPVKGRPPDGNKQMSLF